MNYSLSGIIEVQEKIRSSKSSSIDQNINFFISQSNLFQFEKRGYFKKYEKREISNEKILQIIIEFDQHLEIERKKLHQQFLKKINNDLYAFKWSTEEDYLKHRSCWFSSELISFVGSLLGKHVDWKYPVIYVEPNSGDLMRVIGAGDPFYIIDDLELPYKEILKKFPLESVNRFLYYTKTQVKEHLVENSAGLVVSWKNFPFMKLGEIKKDLTIMKSLVAPGGIIMFDYVDATSTKGAREIELGKCGFQWKERIHSFLNELELEIIQEIDDHGDYPFNIVFCKNSGTKKEINLNNKIGLVLLQEEVAAEKREHTTELRKYYKSITSEHQRDIERFRKRDQELLELDKQRQKDPTKILKAKLKVALKNLDTQRATYRNNEHPGVLEAVLHVSKLTFQLGRHKDSYNLIKQISKDIRKLELDSRLYQEYADWLDFLNNIDI